MTALTAALPGNSSRTRIQAMIVPKIALITTTIKEQITVSFSEATAWGEVTALQKASKPPSSDWLTTAASGRRTIRLR
jgi:hypothetical protein